MWLVHLFCGGLAFAVGARLGVWALDLLDGWRWRRRNRAWLEALTRRHRPALRLGEVVGAKGEG